MIYGVHAQQSLKPVNARRLHKRAGPVVLPLVRGPAVILGTSESSSSKQEAPGPRRRRRPSRGPCGGGASGRPAFVRATVALVGARVAEGWSLQKKTVRDADGTTAQRAPAAVPCHGRDEPHDTRLPERCGSLAAGQRQHWRGSAADAVHFWSGSPPLGKSVRDRRCGALRDGSVRLKGSQRRLPIPAAATDRSGGGR